MNLFTKDNKTLLVYLLPTVIVCLYFLIVSYDAPLHDFSNSYFSARLIHDGIVPETVIFDIHAFNAYIWGLGYTDVLVDFYVNSPFTLAAFYPLAYIEDAYLAKFVFNSISVLLFLAGLFLLAKKTIPDSKWLLLCIPILFYVPIRNQILFGQSYFIVFFFVVAGYDALEKRREYGTGMLLSFATLLKFFPVFYGIPLAFQKRWKAIGLCILGTLLFVIVGIFITGYTLWESYFLDILPHTFSSKTTTDYRVNYQSLDVFFKFLFVEDSYYNPTAWIANERIYAIANWITKAIIIGSAIGMSIRKKNNTFALLAIWVTTLFLTQGRTATYAQILWVIPLFVVFPIFMNKKYTILNRRARHSEQRLNVASIIVLLGLLMLICNFPFRELKGEPIVIQFSRLWLVVLLTIYMCKLIDAKFHLKYIALTFVVLFPLSYGALKGKSEDNSQYALSEKKHFMIYDFFEDQGKLSYKALGRNGDETIQTDISVTSFDTESITIKDHQLYHGDQLITENISLKKKPVLVNHSRVYFLTDHHSRRGAFTLKYIDIN
ncbi:glycosyltransferase family 87 protein [uncultured Dokdonia sp.]|uniref:glycosyltransferase family 87 protein n=1 Tax=uncultured Dokdonia sp. TaxID=575653 RepID=UPI0026113020|nr:glycosyltransferase family 87 protein [uncultured Dokdonia sp.]